jgi:DNA-binding NtrC family response regulator
MRVLIVSANSSLVSELTPIFSTEADQILLSDSARKAIQTFAADPDIDLVVVEVAGKSSGSLQFLREFKTDRRRAMIPVIAAGRGFDAETVRAFVELRVDDIATLPLDRETFRARAQKLCEDKRPTILVVDDEPAIRELLEDVLKWERFRILTATSADEAIRFLAESRVDVVVSDVSMPGKSGQELLTFLKSTYPHVPVIMITGFSDRTMLKKLMASGADGFFTKPFHSNELIATVHRVIAMRRRTDRSASEPVH